MATPRNRRPGLGNVGSYQVAGTPFLTASTLEVGDVLAITFPAVTKHVHVHVTGAKDVQVSFGDPTDGSVALHKNFITLNGNVNLPNALSGAFDMEVKCKEIYLKTPAGAGSGQTGFELYASLTGIEPAMMFTLSGSGINLP